MKGQNAFYEVDLDFTLSINLTGVKHGEKG